MALDIWGGVEPAKNVHTFLGIPVVDPNLKSRGDWLRDYYNTRKKNEGGGLWTYAWGLKGHSTKIGCTSGNPYKRAKLTVPREIHSHEDFDIVAFNVVNKPIDNGTLELLAHRLAALMYGHDDFIRLTGKYNGCRMQSGKTEVFKCSVEEASNVIFKCLRMTDEQRKKMFRVDSKEAFEKFMASL